MIKNLKSCQSKNERKNKVIFVGRGAAYDFASVIDIFPPKATLV
jgi:hypothetical protein